MDSIRARWGCTSPPLNHEAVWVKRRRNEKRGKEEENNKRKGFDANTFLPFSPHLAPMNQAGGPPAGGAPPPFRPQASTAVQYSCAGTLLDIFRPTPRSSES